MDSRAALIKEVDVVYNKITALKKNSLSTLGDIIKHAEKASEQYTEDNNEQSSPLQKVSLGQSCKNITDTLTKLSSDHRDIHSSISKLGKTIDKAFVSDYSTLVKEVPSFGDEVEEEELNEVIYEHLLQTGLPEVANTFAEEAGLERRIALSAEMSTLREVTEALLERRVQPALDWCAQHDLHNRLEFQLLRLQFIVAATQPKPDVIQALKCARLLTPHVGEHATEVQQLMGALAYVHVRLENSPYAGLLDHSLWTEAVESFHAELCHVMDIPLRSPIEICLNVGCSALPNLLGIMQVLEDKHFAGFMHGEEELPIQVKLPPQYQFHSVFACPILKTQTSHNNPPLKLLCGHVISREAVTKLSANHKMRCPYCPNVDQDLNQTESVYF